MNNLFNILYKKIILEQNLQGNQNHQENIFYFKESLQGQKIQNLIQISFNNKLNEYIKKYPEFSNVKLEFDFNSFNSSEYARLKNPGKRNPIIQINTYSLFEFIYYGASLDDLLDWHDYTNCTIAHELAHINVFKKFKYNSFKSTEQLHNKIFNNEFFKLSGKHLSDIPEQQYGGI